MRQAWRFALGERSPPAGHKTSAAPSSLMSSSLLDVTSHLRKRYTTCALREPPHQHEDDIIIIDTHCYP